MSLRPSNPRLLERLTPFVVATPDKRESFDLSPFGLEVLDEHVVDPLRTRSEAFLELLVRLDAATFGPEGMPMPRWIFVDGAELPGGIVGFGQDARELSEAARRLLRVPPEHRGLVPLSMYVAVPTWEPGVWMGHNLASLGPRLPDDDLRGLGGVTKAVALRALRASGQLGVTQWDSRALHVHTRMGPLALVTAFTPAHSEPRSLTYRAATDDAALRSLAREPGVTLRRPPAALHVRPDDEAAMRALQARIEAGERLAVVDRPVDGVVPVGPAAAG